MKTTAKTASTKKVGIGQFVVSQIEKLGTDYEAVLAAVKKEFPKSKTTLACIRWYASKNFELRA